MPLDLSEEHKEHLAVLPQVDSTVVSEFGRIVVEFPRWGSNCKIYEGAARKLSVSSDTVQHGVEELIYLLPENSKLMISELDFQDCFCSGILWRIEQTLASALSGQQKGDQNYPEWISTRPPQLPQPLNGDWMYSLQAEASGNRLNQQRL